MRSVEEYLDRAEDALDRFERERDPTVRDGLLLIAREWFALATARMQDLGIAELEARAERVWARLDS